ncbi:HAD family hydrolase [Piscinibacter sakaiensis]|uniref:HAD family hydrolase n=1 Tax=Piscinibacter sakaiensis TaxID=1547922 RepID=UPI003AAB7E8B
MATTLVFDLGGVVLHWQPAELLRHCLAQRIDSDEAASVLATSFFESFRPGGAWAEFDRGSLSATEVARRIADGASGLSHAEVERVMDAIPAHLQLRPDTAALLAELHRAGHRLVYLSNMPATYVDHVQQQLARIDGAFDGGIFSSEVGIVKPESAIFQLAERHFGSAADELLFFDDNPVNVDAAARLGWQARLFVDADGARSDLVEAGLLPAGEALAEKQ